MSTKKEGTLEIKDLKGISRYLSSPNQDPNKFHTLQNIWSPQRGEHAVIDGVQNVVNNIPNLGEVLQLQSLRQTWGENSWLLWYHSNFNTIPVPAGMTYTTLGPPFENRGISVQYVLPGGVNSPCFSTITMQTVGTNGLQITTPTNLQGGIHSINYWIETSPGSGKYFWAGTMYRKNGVFAASITIFANATVLNGADTVVEDTPTGFDIQPTTGGSLEGDRQYFFAYSPWLPTAGTTLTNQRYVVSLADTSLRFFAVTLPAGFSAFLVKMTGQVGTAGNFSATPYTRCNLWMGPTPEDMLPVAPLSDGTITPVLLATLKTSGMTITDLPHSCDQIPSMAETASGEAAVGRLAAFVQIQFDLLSALAGVQPNAGNVNSQIGLCSVQIPYSTSSHKEIYGNWKSQGTQNINFVTANNVPVPIEFIALDDVPTDNDQYLDRRYYVDGIQTPVYTNGRALYPMVRDSGTKVIPITTRIRVYKDSFCLAGGTNNFSNTRGAIYYSDVVGTSAKTYSFGTTDWNYLTAQFGDPTDIVGLGIYSRDLSTVGAASFLLVGKSESTLSWNGGRTATDQQLIELGKYNGWTSKDCFCLTKIGAVFVARNNVYLISGADIAPMGDDVQEIIQSITEANLQYTVAQFVKDRLIISYRQDANIDREIWCDFRHAPDNSVEYIWTGPHRMKSYNGVVIVPSYAGIRDYRLSFLNENLYRRDVPNVHTNDGAEIDLVWITHDMALSADALMKVLTKLFLRCKINRQEQITLTIDVIDQGRAGSGIYATDPGENVFHETIVLNYGGSSTEVYRLFQKIFSTRYRGSILKLTLRLSTNVDFRLNLVDVLFNTQSRRIL